MSTSAYLSAFLKDKHVAAVTPTSSFGTRRVCQSIDFEHAELIIEYGPGTGVFTRYLLDRMQADAELLAIETNEKLISILEDDLDDDRLEVVHGDATNVRSILDERNRTRADYIISGIPFTWLDEETRHDLMEQSLGALKPGGLFLAYQTFWQPDAHLKDPASEYFHEVTSEFELRNLPPMRIYRARKENNTTTNGTP